MGRNCRTYVLSTVSPLRRQLPHSFQVFSGHPCKKLMLYTSWHKRYDHLKMFYCSVYAIQSAPYWSCSTLHDCCSSLALQSPWYPIIGPRVWRPVCSTTYICMLVMARQVYMRSASSRRNCLVYLNGKQISCRTNLGCIWHSDIVG